MERLELFIYLFILLLREKKKSLPGQLTENWKYFALEPSITFTYFKNALPIQKITN